MTFRTICCRFQQFTAAHPHVEEIIHHFLKWMPKSSPFTYKALQREQTNKQQQQQSNASCRIYNVRLIEMLHTFLNLLVYVYVDTQSGCYSDLTKIRRMRHGGRTVFFFIKKGASAVL